MAGGCQDDRRDRRDLLPISGHPRRTLMPAKIIISYDGTANEDDALRSPPSAQAADVALAYSATPLTLGEHLGPSWNRGGPPPVAARGPERLRRTSYRRSTPRTRCAAVSDNADLIVVRSTPTPPRATSRRNSRAAPAARWRTAVAIAPVDFAETPPRSAARRRRPTRDGGAAIPLRRWPRIRRPAQRRVSGEGHRPARGRLSCTTLRRARCF